MDIIFDIHCPSIFTGKLLTSANNLLPEDPDPMACTKEAPGDYCLRAGNSFLLSVCLSLSLSLTLSLSVCPLLSLSLLSLSVTLSLSLLLTALPLSIKYT